MKLALLLLATFAFVTVFAGDTRADRPADASQIIILSDDIYKRSTRVTHSGDGDDGGGDPGGAGTGGSGNDDNRSGLGDDTNPGQVDGRGNSPNEGTNNPNQAGR